MKEIGISEWQEMAIKKDIEEIKRKQNSQTSIFLSLGWEVAVTYGTVLYDQLFDIKITDVKVLILIICGAVLPVILVLAHKVSEWISSVIRAKSGNLRVKDQIDLFDNEISYWVMLSNSYTDMLEKQIDENQCTEAEHEFLYCEGCYYNNKTIGALYDMKPIVDKIFSNEIEDVKHGNRVGVSRLQNLIKVMNEQQIRLDNTVKDTTNQRIILQLDLNKQYANDLEEVFNDLNEVFFKDEKISESNPNCFLWEKSWYHLEREKSE
ncbi:MAG: hypothetical protein IKE92_03185 [Clostridiales bacterium]|nr:hypothetical protein [Clostridiales bacterium]